MESKTYIYETSKGLNEETFTSNGYVTLIQNGLFKYEHHFSSFTIKVQEALLIDELNKRNIKFKIVINK